LGLDIGGLLQSGHEIVSHLRLLRMIGEKVDLLHWRLHLTILKNGVYSLGCLVVINALHKKFLTSIFLLSAFLAADSGIPRALDHPILIIVGINVRQVESLHMDALIHLRPGFLILLVEVHHASRGDLGWRVRAGLHNLGLLDRQLIVLVAVVHPG